MELYCFAICESGNIFLSNEPYLLAMVQQSENCFQQSNWSWELLFWKLFVNGLFWWITVIAGCRSDEGLSLCVCMCFNQYMSLYISFTLMSTIKFPRTSHTYKVCSRAWSLHWLFPYRANQFCLGSFIIFTAIFKFVEFLC
jgi:hypothetical protein